MSMSLIILLWTCSVLANLSFAATYESFGDITVVDLLIIALLAPLIFMAMLLVIFLARLTQLGGAVLWRRR